MESRGSSLKECKQWGMEILGLLLDLAYGRFVDSLTHRFKDPFPTFDDGAGQGKGAIAVAPVRGLGHEYDLIGKTF